MHECPVCGQACHCSGDIEDHDVGDEFYYLCTCCDGRQDEDEDEDSFDWEMEYKEDPTDQRP